MKKSSVYVIINKLKKWCLIQLDKKSKQHDNNKFMNSFLIKQPIKETHLFFISKTNHINQPAIISIFTIHYLANHPHSLSRKAFWEYSQTQNTHLIIQIFPFADIIFLNFNCKNFNHQSNILANILKLNKIMLAVLKLFALQIS